MQIRFAMPEPDRPEFLRRLRTISEGLPIAAQLEWTLSDQTPTHPDKIISPIPLLTPLSTASVSRLESSTAESGFEPETNMTLQIDVGCGDYDIVRPLKDGNLRAEGLEINFITINRPPEVHWRMGMHQEFD